MDETDATTPSSRRPTRGRAGLLAHLAEEHGETGSVRDEFKLAFLRVWHERLHEEGPDHKHPNAIAPRTTEERYPKLFEKTDWPSKLPELKKKAERERASKLNKKTAQERSSKFAELKEKAESERASTLKHKASQRRKGIQP